MLVNMKVTGRYLLIFLEKCPIKGYSLYEMRVFRQEKSELQDMVLIIQAVPLTEWAPLAFNLIKPNCGGRTLIYGCQVQVPSNQYSALSKKAVLIFRLTAMSSRADL